MKANFSCETLKIVEKQLPKVARLKELKAGDAILFFNGKNHDKLNEKTWNFGNVRHNAIVGEVYSDRVVIYDVGSYFPRHQDYKRTIYFPAEDTEEADNAAVQKAFKYNKNVIGECEDGMTLKIINFKKEIRKYIYNI